MAEYMADFLTRMKSRTSEIRTEIATATLDAKGSNPLAGHGTPAVGKLQSSMLKSTYDIDFDEVLYHKKKINDVSDVLRATMENLKRADCEVKEQIERMQNPLEEPEPEPEPVFVAPKKFKIRHKMKLTAPKRARPERKVKEEVESSTEVEQDDDVESEKEAGVEEEVPQEDEPRVPRFVEDVSSDEEEQPRRVAKVFEALPSSDEEYSDTNAVVDPPPKGEGATSGMEGSEEESKIDVNESEKLEGEEDEEEAKKKKKKKKKQSARKKRPPVGLSYADIAMAMQKKEAAAMQQKLEQEIQEIVPIEEEIAEEGDYTEEDGGSIALASDEEEKDGDAAEGEGFRSRARSAASVRRKAATEEEQDDLMEHKLDRAALMKQARKRLAQRRESTKGTGYGAQGREDHLSFSGEGTDSLEDEWDDWEEEEDSAGEKVRRRRERAGGRRTRREQGDEELSMEEEFEELSGEEGTGAMSRRRRDARRRRKGRDHYGDNVSGGDGSEDDVEWSSEVEVDGQMADRKGRRSRRRKGHRSSRMIDPNNPTDEVPEDDYTDVSASSWEEGATEGARSSSGRRSSRAKSASSRRAKRVAARLRKEEEARARREALASGTTDTWLPNGGNATGSHQGEALSMDWRERTPPGGVAEGRKGVWRPGAGPEGFKGKFAEQERMDWRERTPPDGDGEGKGKDGGVWKPSGGYKGGKGTFLEHDRMDWRERTPPDGYRDGKGGASGAWKPSGGPGGAKGGTFWEQDRMDWRERTPPAEAGKASMGKWIPGGKSQRKVALEEPIMDWREKTPDKSGRDAMRRKIAGTSFKTGAAGSSFAGHFERMDWGVRTPEKEVTTRLSAKDLNLPPVFHEKLKWEASSKLLDVELPKGSKSEAYYRLQETSQKRREARSARNLMGPPNSVRAEAAAEEAPSVTEPLGPAQAAAQETDFNGKREIVVIHDPDRTMTVPTCASVQQVFRAPVFREDGVIAMPQVRTDHELEMQLRRRRAVARQRWQRAFHYARKIVASDRLKRVADGQKLLETMKKQRRVATARMAREARRSTSAMEHFRRSVPQACDVSSHVVNVRRSLDSVYLEPRHTAAMDGPDVSHYRGFLPRVAPSKSEPALTSVPARRPSKCTVPPSINKPVQFLPPIKSTDRQSAALDECAEKAASAMSMQRRGARGDVRAEGVTAVVGKASYRGSAKSSVSGRQRRTVDGSIGDSVDVDRPARRKHHRSLSVEEEHTTGVLSPDAAMSKCAPNSSSFVANGNILKHGAPRHSSVYQPAPHGFSAAEVYYRHPAGGVAAHKKLGGRKLVATRRKQHPFDSRLPRRSSSQPDITLPFDDL